MPAWLSILTMYVVVARIELMKVSRVTSLHFVLHSLKGKESNDIRNNDSYIHNLCTYM